MIPEISGCSSLFNEVRKLTSLKRELRDVWTIRVSVGGVFAERCIKEIAEKGVLIASYHSHLKEVELRGLVNYLSYGNTYASLKVSSNQELDLIPEILESLSNILGADSLTRVAFSIGGEVESPYFPLSFPKRYGVAVSLRYADELKGLHPDDYVKRVSSVLSMYSNEVEGKSKRLGVPYLGVDASLSPWMDESVVPIVEAASRASIPSVGIASGIRAINKAIEEAVKRASIPSLGFNELMLPVGEDNILKKLVSEGKLRLHHLTMYPAYCVAGLDMVGVPKDKELIVRAGRDLITAHEVKGRPVGMRIIITERPRIEIKHFGVIPMALP